MDVCRYSAHTLRFDFHLSILFYYLFSFIFVPFKSLPYSYISFSGETALSYFHLIKRYTMPTQDRTNEFRACVESIRNRSSISSRAAEQRQALLQRHGKENKSDFSRMASAISKDINTTTLKLGKLAQCA